MEKEKKLSICSKFISALIIVMVIISSYGTFLSEVAAAVSEYENQKTEAGADGHYLEHFRFHFDDLFALLKAKDVTELAIYQKGKRIMVPLPV